MSSSSPILWVVATPIGNLGDLSPRAREVLTQADIILAEDTRITGRLLHLTGISGKRLMSLYEHNETARIEQVLDLLGQGHSLALVSSAGTPLMSDPGYALVKACRLAGFGVSPVPGPSAPIAALMASGLPPLPFTFLGFLPRKTGDKRRLFEEYAQVSTTLVFFERISRLQTSLHTAHSVLGQREVCLARELTKRYESFLPLSLHAQMEVPEGLAGEVTVIIAPGGKKARVTETEEVVRILRDQAKPGLGAKAVVAQSAKAISGWGKKALYDLYQREVKHDRS